MTHFFKRSACERCPNLALCQTSGPSAKFSAQQRRLKRHDLLYQAGELATGAIYCIRSGSFKLLFATDSGVRQVIGFAFATEFLGLTSLGRLRHASTAEALEDSEVCCISWDSGANAGRNAPLPPSDLCRLLAVEMRREQQATVTLQNANAAQRMAELLLMLASRRCSPGATPLQFRLPMSRRELASYLGVTPEWLSRMIADFSHQALIKMDGRDITFLNAAALQLMVAGQANRT